MAGGLGLAGGGTPAEGFKNMMPALQSAYEQQNAQKAGMALLGSLPGGNQSQQQPSSFGAIGPGASYAKPVSNIVPGPDMQLPRGIRNNNPLNIEAGPFTQGLPGFAGSDGRFAKFQMPEQGVGAANSLLDVYQNQHGLNTVAGIIGRWAPAGENDTRGYVASVAGRLGVDPNQPLTPEQRIPLIQAMGQFENGRPISMGQPSQAMGMGGVPERPNAQGVLCYPRSADTISHADAASWQSDDQSAGGWIARWLTRPPCRACRIRFARPFR
jgi:hypothetical protein